MEKSSGISFWVVFISLGIVCGAFAAHLRGDSEGSPRKGGLLERGRVSALARPDEPVNEEFDLASQTAHYQPSGGRFRLG